MKQDLADLSRIIESSKKVTVIQADNPDADSLGSALALDEILTDLGKDVTLYCGVDMPSYLHYLSGWSRIEKNLPAASDCYVVVDASTTTLLEKIQSDTSYKAFLTGPTIVLDHHANVDNAIPAELTINDTSLSSASELVYSLSKAHSWPVSVTAGESIMSGILGDTQGLSNDLARPSTYIAMAELIQLGVNRSQLEEKRREFNKLHLDIYRYKAELINKTEFHDDNAIACVSISQQEINQYSPLYNPAALIQPDMLQIEGVKLSIVFKAYDDGKVTGAIRSNSGAPVAGKLASELGGGGHDYASGFKITDGRSLSDIKLECVKLGTELLRNISKDND